MVLRFTIAILLTGVLLGKVARSNEPAAAPPVTIQLLGRNGQALPQRHGFTHTGGGNVSVTQTTADSFVVLSTAVAVAGGHPAKNSLAVLQIDVEQCFEIVVDPGQPRSVNLSLEGQLTGVLRSHHHSRGMAEVAVACASVGCESGDLIGLTLPNHSVCGGESKAVNDQRGPITLSVSPGRYRLRQRLIVQANHPQGLLPCKPSSAEFAPEPALDPLWISAHEPFHGVVKEEFGFQVTIKAWAQP